MALAIIGGYPERFAPFAELHRRAAAEGGHAPQPLVSINSHGFIAERSQDAVKTSFPAFKAMMDRIGRERGWPPLTPRAVPRLARAARRELRRQPGQIVEKILFQHEIFEHDRFLLQMSVGTLPHADVMRAIELLGTEVAPKVREALEPSGREPVADARVGADVARRCAESCGAGWRCGRAGPGRRWRTPGPRRRPAARGGSSAARG